MGEGENNESTLGAASTRDVAEAERGLEALEGQLAEVRASVARLEEANARLAEELSELRSECDRLRAALGQDPAASLQTDPSDELREAIRESTFFDDGAAPPEFHMPSGRLG